MPNYTTSYSSQNKPRYRKNTGNQLPSGRRRQQRRKGAQYLRRSQGFGGRRRSGRGYGGNDRKAYALIIVGCAFLLFVASIVWYVNRSVEITLNGQAVKVRIHSDIERVIADQGLEPSPGDLLSVNDKVLQKGAGSAYTVSLDGKELSAKKAASLEIEGGEELSIEDGADVYEDHDIQVTEIEPTLTVEGSGPVRYVETWGKAGRSEVWTGRQTGEVVDKGVVEEPVDAVIKCVSVLPSAKGKKYVALTFDEGPSERTADIVRILEEKGVKATFFVEGDKVAGASDALRAIEESGNELGTNAFADVDLGEMSATELRDQISRSFDAVENATGERPTLLRPPFGSFSDRNWADAMDLMGAVVTWNVDSGDWLLQGAASVVETVAGSVGNGDIVLLTDNEATVGQTVEALPQIIDRLKEAGYELVTVSELISTDDDLKAVVKTGRTGIPKGACLPVLPTEGE